MSGSAAAITGALVAVVIVVVDPLLDAIPASAGPVLFAAVNLLVVLFAAFGVHRSAVRFGGRLTTGD